MAVSWEFYNYSSTWPRGPVVYLWEIFNNEELLYVHSRLLYHYCVVWALVMSVSKAESQSGRVMPWVSQLVERPIYHFQMSMCVCEWAYVYVKST